jgi:hypothetical protein
MTVRQYLERHPVLHPTRLADLRRTARDRGITASHTETVATLATMGYTLADPDGRGYVINPPERLLPASTVEGWTV